MKIAHLGASGHVGSKILDEALRRGHTVTAIVRNPDRMPEREGLTALAADADDPGEVAPLLVGHDVVVSSIRFTDIDPDSVIGATISSGVPRLAVVGGAGTLKGPDGKDLLDGPNFPEAYKPEALAGRAFLEKLRTTSGLDWTFVSPSAEFVPGERTGKFRLGHDDLLIGKDGQSRISQEDFAIAFVDELEKPKHSKRRFTVGY
jgi:putative NADH-flavin reductase